MNLLGEPDGEDFWKKVSSTSDFVVLVALLIECLVALLICRVAEVLSCARAQQTPARIAKDRKAALH